MRPTSVPGSGPASHTTAAPEAAPRSALRALCSPAALTGSRTEQLQPDVVRRPGQSPAVRALFAADPLAARTPVLLVHGLVDNRSIFAVMRRSLRRRGFASVCSWNYSPLLRDVATAASDLGEHIERICAQTGHDRVHVVGHSLGGLIARYHVQRQGGDRRVDELVTLGTPHGGSLLAHVLPTPLVRQLRPGSPLLRELDEPVDGCATRITAVYSDLDQLVLPTSAGRCDHPDLGARNVLVRGVGHMSLPIHRGVLDEVALTLAGSPVAGPQAVRAAA